MKKGRILLGITLCSAMLLSTVPVNAEGKTYKKYDLSDIVYFNPTTAKVCTEGENDCMKWYVANIDDTTAKSNLSLILSDVIISSVASINVQEVTGCFINDYYDSSVTTQSRCDDKDGVWKTEELNLGDDNIDNALLSLMNSTKNWNNKLTLSTTFGRNDYTGYKARLLTTTEVKSIYNLYNQVTYTGWKLNENDAKNDLLFSNNSRNPVLLEGDENKYYSLSGGSWGGIPTVRFQIAAYGEPDYGIAGTLDIRPVIEIDKDWLINKNVKIDNSIKSYISVDDSNPAIGNTISITAKNRKGYTLKSIKVLDENNNEVTVTNNTFTMPDTDVTITAEYEPIVYKFIEGQNAAYNNTDLTFKLDGDITLVDKILVNGKELDKNNFTLTEGSTIVTLKNDYLKTLKAGTYELEVTYTNESSDKTTFKVEEKKIETTSKEENSNESNSEITSEIKEENPTTLDNVLFYVTLGSLSMIGLAGAGLYLKKRFN